MKIFKIFLTLIFILFLNSCDDKTNHSFGVVNLNLSNSQDFEDSNSRLIARKLDYVRILISGEEVYYGVIQGSFNFTTDLGSAQITVELLANNYLNNKEIKFRAQKQVYIVPEGVNVNFLVNDFTPINTSSNFYFYENFNDSFLNSSLYADSQFSRITTAPVVNEPFFAIGTGVLLGEVDHDDREYYTRVRLRDLNLPSSGQYTLVFYYRMQTQPQGVCTLDVFIHDPDNFSSSGIYVQKRYGSGGINGSYNSDYGLYRAEVEFSTNSIPNGDISIYFGFFVGEYTYSGAEVYLDNIQVYWQQ